MDYQLLLQEQVFSDDSAATTRLDKLDEGGKQVEKQRHTYAIFLKC